MKKIVDFIRSYGTFETVAAGALIKSKHNDIFTCHLIETGMAVTYYDIHARPAETVRGPCIVGLTQLLHPQDGLGFKMIHPSVIHSIPAHMLSKMITENNMWHEVAEYFSGLVYELSLKGSKRKTEDTATVIYKALQSLQHETEEVRIMHTVNDYVQYLSGFSYSTISRTLDVFKKQGCIEIQNGLLIRLHERVETE